MNEWREVTCPPEYMGDDLLTLCESYQATKDRLHRLGDAIQAKTGMPASSFLYRMAELFAPADEGAPAEHD